MRKLVVPAGALLTAALMAGVARAETELQNDGFMSGQNASFQLGFAAGEIGAVRLTPTAPGQQILKVRLLFGGGGTMKTITLHIWDDSAGTLMPGVELYEGDFELSPSNNAFHDLDISTDSVLVPGPFRVGIEFQHAGAPSIARDVDNTIAATRNFIFADIGTGPKWHQSNTFGLMGDWIIRGVVADMTGTPDAGVTIDASTGGPDASPGGPDAGGGDACTGNGDCEIG
jgi:hypothetical protein